MRGVPVPVIQQPLGHAVTRTTSNYTVATGLDLTYSLLEATGYRLPGPGSLSIRSPLVTSKRSAHQFSARCDTSMSATGA